MNKDFKHSNNSRKTFWVVVITFLTMITEVSFGLSTHSVALLSDGIHMGSHFFALSLSWITYRLIYRLSKSQKIRINDDKILHLAAFTSGIILLLFALIILYQAVQRFLFPMEINAAEALVVAFIGLIVNLLSAIILHQSEDNKDINVYSAYLHVLADTLTSMVAIIGLLMTMYLSVNYFDLAAGILSGIIIIRWAIRLIYTTATKLIELEYL